MGTSVTSGPLGSQSPFCAKPCMDHVRHAESQAPPTESEPVFKDLQVFGGDVQV